MGVELLHKLKRRCKREYVWGVLLAIPIIINVLSIFIVNIIGRQWVNYDIYSDIMVAKYMSDFNSFFPDNWVFGNQYYIVATPNIAALLNCFIDDIYLCMGLASCIMTMLLMVSFIWCVKPFANNINILVGLLCISGGTILGSSASSDWDGLQVFYTMASYYACYCIGIFVTVGVWLRVYVNKSVSVFMLILSILLNFALGMQSLRETLVLNIPIAITAIFIFLFKKPRKLITKANLYVLIACICNLLGLTITKILEYIGVANKHDILQELNGNIIENFKYSIDTFISYTGINFSISGYGIFKSMVGIVAWLIVVGAIIMAIKNRFSNAISLCMLFCWISLLAVLLAGTFIIKVRPLYFFVWYLLLACSAVYVFEYIKNLKIRCGIICLLLAIWAGNYYFNYRLDYRYYNEKQQFYLDVTQKIDEMNIDYAYVDWKVLDNGVISSFTNGDVLCVTFKFNDDMWDDLVCKIEHLYSKDWYEDDNYSNSCIVLTNRSLDNLKANYSEQYVSKIMAELDLLYTDELKCDETTYYFYRCTERFYVDMVS